MFRAAGPHFANVKRPVTRMRGSTNDPAFRLRGPSLSIPVAARSARQLVLETPAGHGLPLVLQLDAVAGELDGHDVLQHQAGPRLGPLLGSRDVVDTLVLTREDERDRGAVARTETVFGRAAMVAAYKPR